jgi:hypothetical protein
VEKAVESMRQPRKETHIYLELQTYQQLKYVAERNKRSITAQIEIYVRRGLEAEKRSLRNMARDDAD